MTQTALLLSVAKLRLGRCLSCLSLPGGVATTRRLCKHFLHSFTERVEGYCAGRTRYFISETLETFLLYQFCQEALTYRGSFRENRRWGWERSVRKQQLMSMRSLQGGTQCLDVKSHILCLWLIIGCSVSHFGISFQWSNNNIIKPDRPLFLPDSFAQSSRSKLWMRFCPCLIKI